MITINWLDFTIILIMGLFVISGFRDGLLKQLVGLFGFVIAFFVALYASKPLGEKISLLVASDADYVGKETLEPITETLSGLKFFLGIDTVISIICFIVLFIFMQVVIAIFAGKLKLFNFIPLVGFVNIIGGLFLGAVKGFLSVFILITIMSLLPHDYVGETLTGSVLAVGVSELLPEIYLIAKSFFLEHYYLLAE